MQRAARVRHGLRLKPAVRRANRVDHVAGEQIGFCARHCDCGDERNRRRADSCECGGASAAFHRVYLNSSLGFSDSYTVRRSVRYRERQSPGQWRTVATAPGTVPEVTFTYAQLQADAGKMPNNIVNDVSACLTTRLIPASPVVWPLLFQLKTGITFRGCFDECSDRVCGVARLRIPSMFLLPHQP